MRGLPQSSGNLGHCWVKCHTPFILFTDSVAKALLLAEVKARPHFGLSKTQSGPKVVVATLPGWGKEYNICKLWKSLPFFFLLHFSFTSHQNTSKQPYRILFLGAIFTNIYSLLSILCPGFLFPLLYLQFISEHSWLTSLPVVRFSCEVPHILPCTPGLTSVRFGVH